MIITIEHFRAVGLCSRGAVNRMKRFGLTDAEIMHVLKNGIPEEQLRSYGDAQAEIAIAHAHRMEAEKTNNG